MTDHESQHPAACECMGRLAVWAGSCHAMDVMREMKRGREGELPVRTMRLDENKQGW